MAVTRPGSQRSSRQATFRESRGERARARVRRKPRRTSGVNADLAEAAPASPVLVRPDAHLDPLLPQPREHALHGVQLGGARTVTPGRAPAPASLASCAIDGEALDPGLRRDQTRSVK